jgi:peptidoglycan hydrolase CwlO-like protein
MTIELALLLSGISVAFAIYEGITNMRRNKKADEKTETSELTTVIVKLENIGNGISEIKSEISSIKEDTKQDHERIIKLEASMGTVRDAITKLEGGRG